MDQSFDNVEETRNFLILLDPHHKVNVLQFKLEN